MQNCIELSVFEQGSRYFFDLMTLNYCVSFNAFIKNQRHDKSLKLILFSNINFDPITPWYGSSFLLHLLKLCMVRDSTA